MFLDNDELNVDQNVLSNQIETDKINLIFENTTKIKVSFDFTGSMLTHTGKSGALDNVQIYFRIDNDLGVRLLEQVR